MSKYYLLLRDRLAYAILIPCDIVRMSTGIKNGDNSKKDRSGRFVNSGYVPTGCSPD